MTEAEVLSVKAAVRLRDGHCCIHCGMTGAQHYARWGSNLEVHRLTPGSLYSLEGCVTLCKDCHAREPKRPAETADLARPSQVVSLPDDVYQMMKTLADSQDRPVRFQILIAVREHLRANGKWPPPPVPEKEP